MSHFSSPNKKNIFPVNYFHKILPKIETLRIFQLLINVFQKSSQANKFPKNGLGKKEFQHFHKHSSLEETKNILKLKFC